MPGIVDALVDVAQAWRQALERARTAARQKDRLAALAQARAYVEAGTAILREREPRRPRTGVQVLEQLLSITRES
jgi:hypothetical protein